MFHCIPREGYTVMKFQTDKKSALDPVFGLPVARDSKAMDIARSRNFRSDKRLEVSLKTIDHTMHSKIIRCQNLVAKTREFLASINPEPKRRIVCPSGLSADQKQTIRLIRRGSLPSMTLHEFDQKFSSAKASRQTSPSNNSTEDVEKNQLTEFKIKRKVYSRNSKKFPHSKSVSNMELLVLDNAKTTNNPLYRCKTVMDGAYQRLTSADVNHASAKDTSARPASLTDLDRDLKPTNKVFSKSFTEKSFRLPQDLYFGRKGRRVLSDPTSSRDASSRDTSSPSSDSSATTEEERFSRFLNVLRGEPTKLPDILT